MTSIPDSKGPKKGLADARGIAPTPAPVEGDAKGQPVADETAVNPGEGASKPWGLRSAKVAFSSPDPTDEVFRNKSALVRLITPDLEESLENVIDYVNDPARFKSETAERDLKLMHALMLAAKPEQVNLTKLAEPGHARSAIDKAFALQQALGRRMASFGDNYTPAIADEMRNVDRGLHYLGDTVLLDIPGAPKDGEQPQLATEFPNLHWTADPNFQSLDNLPDVFIVTVDGGSEVSDTIKTVTAVDAFVSHLAVVIRKRDATTGKPSYWVAEATSLRGVYVHPLDPATWFQKHVRSMVQVFADDKLQAAYNAAAPKWIDEAYRRQEAGNAIPYNFPMNLGDDTKTMCTQMLLQIAKTPEFKAVLAEPTGFPKFRSRLQTNESVHEILTEWGIANPEVLVPGDISVDPKIKLVATARTLPGSGRPHDINRGHMRSAIYSTIFNDWMQKKNYRLRISNSWRFAAAVALTIRRTPFLGDFLLGTKLQPHVKAGVIASIMDMGAVTNRIYQELEAANRAFLKANGRNMMFEEMTAELERIRLDDLDRYRKWTTASRFQSSMRDGAQADFPHFSLYLEPPIRATPPQGTQPGGVGLGDARQDVLGAGPSSSGYSPDHQRR